MEGRADGCGREAGRARAGGSEWRKALRGVVAERKNRTERAVVLIPVANREN